MEDEELSSLVQAAEQLSSQLDDGSLGELPRVERNLRQIMEASNQLWIRASQTGGQETQGAALLGPVGLDLPRVAHKLDVLSTITNFEPLEPIRETDIKGFLKNERENAILSVIEETRRMSFNHAQQMYWDSVKSEWEKEKQQILSVLTESNDELLDISLPIAEMTSGGMMSILTRSVLDHQEMAYVKTAMEYNDQVIKGGIKPCLAERFAQTAKGFNDKNVSDMWDMVRMMCDVPPKITGDILKSRASAVMQKAFMNQARRYLEDGYKTYIRQTVYSNLGSAKLGGIPGTFPLVRSFVTARQIARTTGLEDGLVEGEPVWPLIFYCLRCGDVHAALQAAKLAGAVLYDFSKLLEELVHSADRNLSPGLETNAKLMYKKMIRTSTDPYKRASYCVVAACDVNDDHTEVALTTDDYLWVKLCQLKEDELAGHDSSHERITYSQFQTLVLEEYGERHFRAHQEPFLYFEVLFLTGQFEAAIDFLAHEERLRCHAVHVALAMFESQFLAVPLNVQSLLLSKEPSKPPMRYLNVARLVMLYTRKFESTDPKEALHYFYFLRGIKGSKGDSLFTTCVSELVLESRNFDLLLGKLDSDGCRTPGFLNHFKGTQVDTQKIIELVARDSESKGLHEDAVHLYELARDDHKVMELLCRLLSGKIAQPAALESESWRVQNRALAVAQRLKNAGSHLPDIAATFFLLLDLGTFFSLYHEEKHNEAFETIAKLRLIPLSLEEVDARVSNFRNLTDDIRRNIPDVLLAVMNILHNKYRQAKTPRGFLKSTRKEDGERDEYMDQIRKQARALTTFIGMIPYRMPGDTHSRLVHLQSLMN